MRVARFNALTIQRFDRFAQPNHMNLNDLANLGQIIGAVAVVISLFYVASQIRQNTNAVRSATAADGARAFRQMVSLGCRRR